MAARGTYGSDNPIRANRRVCRAFWCGRPVVTVTGNGAFGRAPKGRAAGASGAEDARGGEALEPLARVAAHLAEHRLGVLAAEWCAAERGVVAEAQRAGDLADGAELRVLRLDHGSARDRLRIVEGGG